MTPKRYAYSYDRRDYTGSYPSVDAAYADAVARAEGLASPPEAVFIGTVTQADPQAADHADKIVESMNRRAHVDFGDSAARYLRNIPRDRIEELDKMVEQIVLAWLAKNSLMPTFVKVTGVREFPIGYLGGAKTARSNGSEVHDIGIGGEVDLGG